MSEFTIGDHTYMFYKGEFADGFMNDLHSLIITRLDWNNFYHLFLYKEAFKEEGIYCYSQKQFIEIIELLEVMFPDKEFIFDGYYFIDTDLEYILVLSPLILEDDEY